MSSFPAAVLALADGTVFEGQGIGAAGSAVGEMVFNTAMTGYQEILTDPSYCRQIVTLTCPHIGNTGVNEEDIESDRVHASGLVIRDLPLLASSFRSTQSLDSWLRARQVQAIAGIDTRRLTRILRDGGAQSGCILTAAHGQAPDTAKALAAAAEFGGLSGLDLVQEVSCQSAFAWREGQWRAGQGYEQLADDKSRLHVVAYDFGVKRNILRMLVMRGCRVTVVPGNTSAEDVLALSPDGIFLSNGPGDPEPCDYAVAAIQALLAARRPIFGICLGHQLLALACGAKTMKMKTGHHGANHPVKDLDSGAVLITSQNHGFAVDAETLPANLRATHVSLFDGSLQGVACMDAPAFSFQGHPEANPGPRDADLLFDHFIDLMQSARA